MQNLNIRHQFNLYWRKISLTVLILLFFTISLIAQARFNSLSTSGQDDKGISYGFFLAAHTNSWRLKYSDAFMDPQNTELGQIQSIVPVYTPGFSLGFLAVMRLHDQLNLNFTPKVGFYEFKTEINTYTFEGSINNTNPDIPIQRSSRTIVTEATMVEFPLFFKYKAQRFNNNRMFFTAGGSAMFRTKAQDEADLELLVTTGKDYTLDLGMGFDFYFRFFKFSPEVRFSHGMNNVYRPETTDPEFANAIASLRRKSITLYLNFQ
jgi:hypothetical protein